MVNCSVLHCVRACKIFEMHAMAVDLAFKTRFYLLLERCSQNSYCIKSVGSFLYIFLYCG